MSKEQQDEARRAQFAYLHGEWEKQEDWWGQCRRCGKKVHGTPSALRAHQCEEKPCPTS